MQSRRVMVWSTIYIHQFIYGKEQLVLTTSTFQDTLGHLPFSLLQQNEPTLSPTSRPTSRLYLHELLTRYRNLLSNPLHFSSSAPQRLSKPTPISVWYQAFVKVLSFWSCNWRSISLLYLKKIETPPLEVDKELKHWQKCPNVTRH